MRLLIIRKSRGPVKTAHSLQPFAVSADPSLRSRNISGAHSIAPYAALSSIRAAASIMTVISLA